MIKKKFVHKHPITLLCSRCASGIIILDSCSKNVVTVHPSALGLDKICLAKFEQNGKPKERSNSASKMAIDFVKKEKWAKNEL